MRTRPLSASLILLVCFVAALAGMIDKRAEASESSPIESGLHPMPQGRAIPQAWLPPGHGDPDPGPSLAIFPPQRLTLRFNHELHMKLGGMSCLSCHEGAKTSTQAADSILPGPQTCDGCHGTDHTSLSEVKAGPGETGRCGFCHLGWREEEGSKVAPLVIPKPNLHFSHKAHFDRNIGCAQCHGAVENLELATRDSLPRMRGCLRCHDMPEPAKGGAKSDCATCHLTEMDGTLRTLFASGELRPPRWLGGAHHSGDFLLRHRFVAADDAQLCSSCHREDFCTDCHDGKVRPRSFHPNDWLSMHAVAAFQDSPRCTSCHNQQSFCLTCHQRAGVTMSGPNQAGHRFHPPGWADFRSRGKGHHAFEAERNLNACVSCHTERDCASCHAAPGRRGLGINPHGQGFVSRCGSALRRNPRPCLVCHEAGARELASCR